MGVFVRNRVGGGPRPHGRQGMANSQGKLLIVDDNADFRGLLRSRLREHLHGVEVWEAEDLAEADRKLVQCRPRAVLLDLALPDGCGLELAERVQRDAPQTKVFVVTGHDLPEYRDAAKQRGAAGFFAKGLLAWDDVGRVVGAAFS